MIYHAKLLSKKILLFDKKNVSLQSDSIIGLITVVFDYITVDLIVFKFICYDYLYNKFKLSNNAECIIRY